MTSTAASHQGCQMIWVHFWKLSRVRHALSFRVFTSFLLFPAAELEASRVSPERLKLSDTKRLHVNDM